MKKLLSFILAAAMLFGMTTAFAIDEGEARTVIGADISDAQKATVYKTFGIKQGEQRTKQGVEHCAEPMAPPARLVDRSLPVARATLRN